jgi:hypothetical protein
MQRAEKNHEILCQGRTGPAPKRSLVRITEMKGFKLTQEQEDYR